MGAKQNSHSVGGVVVLLVCCVFAASVLLALAFGARIYRSVEGRTESGYNSRVGLSYISTKIHAYDLAGTVSVGDFDGLSALYLAEEADGERYYTILYAADGWLYELYCQDGVELAPDDGEKLLEMGALAFSLEGDTVRAVVTDAQGRSASMETFLRSGGAA
ncbi:DUF4860 domain-containing protein [Intestinibacillus massiliensis]|nr:DUF4860 domain-containing protein [Intestinibacillus massiliensis]